MKINKILLGTVGATAVAITLFFSINKEENGLYESRQAVSLNQSQGIDGAFEYYQMLYKNYDSGVVEPEDYKRAKAEVLAMKNSGSRANISFKDHGPDNVGGRTRAILIDKDDDNLIYAGSVSGGLFVSTNRGNVWKKVEGYVGNYGISSMCQTDNGNIYVATGHYQENFNGGQNSGMNGNGIYFSNDAGQTFNHIVGSENINFINEIVSQGNDVLVAGSTGLQKYSNGTFSSLTSISGRCTALSISEDEQVIIACIKGSPPGGRKTFVSTDAGSNFTKVSSLSPSNTKIPENRGRTEYAFSHEKVNGKYYIYASMESGGALYGVFLSTDNGLTWQRHSPIVGANPAPGAFRPFGANTQGAYDQIITVVKGSPEACLLGGIDINSKVVGGTWETRSFSFTNNQLNPLYVHADQHEMQWDSQGRLWIGNDGGVFYSDDGGLSFREANRGYNVTQFYAISASAHGDVIGGAQDNGTTANYHDNHTYREHDAVGGGDGFSCAMSFINRDIIFTTVYAGAVRRSNNRGISSSAYTFSNIPASYGTPGAFPGNGLGSFYTNIELYENPNDLNSKDTILFTPTESLPSGDTVYIPSATSGKTLTYILTESITFQDTLYANNGLTSSDTIVYDFASNTNFNLYNVNFTYVGGAPPISIGDTISFMNQGVLEIVPVDSTSTSVHYFGTNPAEPGKIVDMGLFSFLESVSWDTIKVQDIYQSWFALGLGNGDGLWLTRNALRFSALHDGALQAGGNINGTVTDMEFSKDGNHLFVGTSTGRLYRLSGLNNAYSPNPDLSSSFGNVIDSLINWNHPNTQTTFQLIHSSAGMVTGIDASKDNPDVIVVSRGGYGLGSKVQKSVNATQALPSFTSISSNLPSMPCLSIVMDREDPNIIFVGTEFGLFRTENGGGAWEYCDAPFGATPIFDLLQNWRTYNEGNHKPGEIYIGTHGRGIWSTAEYLSTPEVQDNTDILTTISALLLYPNPVIDNTTLSFSIQSSGKGMIKVYSLTGKLIIELNELELNTGKNEIQISTENLAKGTYIVQLISNGVSETSKFIKQ